MKAILFGLFDDPELTEKIRIACGYETGEINFREFPDEETYVKIITPVKDRKIIFIADLKRPNRKIIPLLFAAQTARDLGAKEVGLIMPYLVYMRQDGRFHPGEGVTSKYFAAMISQVFDWLVTIDPHLHRYHSLSEIYKIPTRVLYPTELISQWITKHVTQPVLIGPDKESGPWVSQVAQKTNAPFIILEKTREGDRAITVSLPQLEQYKTHTPVLLDDIISTGRTMIEPVKQLCAAKMKAPICIAVHAVFAENAYQDLLKAGASKIITCNTIQHVSNNIDISSLIIEDLAQR